MIFMSTEQEIQNETNSVREIMNQRRSIRRFKQKPIALDFLQELVNVARVAPSAANLQPLEYIIIDDSPVCKQVFETINWAAYLQPKWSPSPEEQPTAYIIILCNTEIANASFSKYDVGLASENIMILAETEDVGSCMICSFNHESVRNLLKIPSKYSLETIIALGYKKEQAVMVPLEDSVEYWRDQKDVHYVPKREMKDILHHNTF